MSDSPKSWLIPAVLAAGVAIALLFFWPLFSPPDSEPALTGQPPAGTAERRRPGPLHPLEPLPSARDDQRELVPLPALSDSDAWFRFELLDLFGDRLEALLTDEAVIEKFVATIDNLPRKHVAERIRPLGRLEGAFRVDGDPEADAVLLAPENFERYDFLVNMIAGTNVDSLVDAYRRYYPLFQEAYVGLGYPDAYFNDRVVEVIDHLLATPQPEEPIRLVRPHVLYEFADTELEALSSGQKLLIRIGPDNAERMRVTLRALRARIAADPPGESW
jgi:hypothetical protein